MVERGCKKWSASAQPACHMSLLCCCEIIMVSITTVHLAHRLLLMVSVTITIIVIIM